MEKGQSTIEFLGSSLIFIIAILIAINSISGDVNNLKNSHQDTSHNMQVYSFTESFLSSSGYKSDGNENWEDSPTETVKFGLAEEYLKVEKEKIDSLETASNSKLNYSRFKEITDTDYNYNFKFIWLPVIETSNYYYQTPKSSDPPISEPLTTLYNRSENRVHYGDFYYNNTVYKFLITAHDGNYDTTRVSKDWDFTAEKAIGTSDNFQLSGSNFTLKNMQNRDKMPGSSVILNRTIKEFGSNSLGVNKDVIKLNRYALLSSSGTELQPMRIEVLSW